MALDLGKQVGPLPLGAWIVVVGGGLGIAYWTKRNQSADTSQEPVVDTSGVPGVGDGSVGGWIPTQPSTGTNTDTAIATNEDWAYKAKQYLIGKGYPAITASSAIDKYIAGLKPSVQEYTLVGIALAAIGPLPQGLPDVVEPDPVPTTPDATQVNKVSGLTVTTGPTSLTAKWTSDKTSNMYRVTISGGGSKRTRLVPFATSVNEWGLKRNTDYYVYVEARSLSGSKYAPAVNVRVRTKK